MMHQSEDNLDTPRLDFEAWRTLLRSNCGGEVKVADPKNFAGWMRVLDVSGLAAAAVKIQWGSAAVDLGCNAHRVERTHRDARLYDADHYIILYQADGQSALTQNDQDVQLAVGDVALVDATRPVTYFTNHSRVQWLSLRLPRKSVLSHLGFEPLGGLSRHGTRVGNVLFDLVRGIHKGDEPSSADSYMQLAIYDLLGALFAPSDPWPVSRHSGKLFNRIRGIINDRLTDPDFGPCDVAAEAGISLRYVQKLFKERGATCNEFIYSARLDHADRLLRRRALLGANQSLSEVAYGCGFRDYTHFARKFRQRFGCAPGAHAKGHGQPVDNGRVRADETASSRQDAQPPPS
jgi:AraC family transcriptional regulator, positive regulator of tynA and feaB